jgi:hypothetical protein
MEAFKLRKYILTMMVLIGSLIAVTAADVRAQETPSTAEKKARRQISSSVDGTPIGGSSCRGRSGSA